MSRRHWNINLVTVFIPYYKIAEILARMFLTEKAIKNRWRLKFYVCFLCYVCQITRALTYADHSQSAKLGLFARNSSFCMHLRADFEWPNNVSYWRGIGLLWLYCLSDFEAKYFQVEDFDFHSWPASARKSGSHQQTLWFIQRFSPVFLYGKCLQ